MADKIIGIPTWKSGNGDFLGAAVTHLRFLEEFGNPRIIMPWEDKVEVDLLYLPGGLDLSPSSYGAIPSVRTSNHDVMKEFFFHNRLKNYVGNTPIFGVCLGMQMLAVHFGSKLTQDLLRHQQSADRWETAHEVTVVDKKLAKSLGIEPEFEVNSHHHQCVLESQLSNELSAICMSDCEEPFKETDRIVEAFKHKTLPIAGVQYHPEELFDDLSLALMTDLILG